ncbi:hypothetical protein C8R46DRAFT_1030620 [Mycena filopes]|nr:hypothetical protein C8R46DRAFT_1030620 [Mycena filopes]
MGHFPRWYQVNLSNMKCSRSDVGSEIGMRWEEEEEEEEEEDKWRQPRELVLSTILSSRFWEGMQTGSLPVVAAIPVGLLRRVRRGSREVIRMGELLGWDPVELDMIRVNLDKRSPIHRFRRCGELELLLRIPSRGRNMGRTVCPAERRSKFDPWPRACAVGVRKCVFQLRLSILGALTDTPSLQFLRIPRWRSVLVPDPSAPLAIRLLKANWSTLKVEHLRQCLTASLCSLTPELFSPRRTVHASFVQVTFVWEALANPVYSRRSTYLSLVFIIGAISILRLLRFDVHASLFLSASLPVIGPRAHPSTIRVETQTTSSYSTQTDEYAPIRAANRYSRTSSPAACHQTQRGQTSSHPPVPNANGDVAAAQLNRPQRRSRAEPFIPDDGVLPLTPPRLHPQIAESKRTWIRTDDRLTDCACKISCIPPSRTVVGGGMGRQRVLTILQPFCIATGKSTRCLPDATWDDDENNEMVLIHLRIRLLHFHWTSPASAEGRSPIPSPGTDLSEQGGGDEEANEDRETQFLGGGGADEEILNSVSWMWRNIHKPERKFKGTLHAKPDRTTSSRSSRIERHRTKDLNLSSAASKYCASPEATAEVVTILRVTSRVASCFLPPSPPLEHFSESLPRMAHFPVPKDLLLHSPRPIAASECPRPAKIPPKQLPQVSGLAYTFIVAEVESKTEYISKIPRTTQAGPHRSWLFVHSDVCPSLLPAALASFFILMFVWESTTQPGLRRYCRFADLLEMEDISKVLGGDPWCSFVSCIGPPTHIHAPRHRRPQASRSLPVCSDVTHQTARRKCPDSTGPSSHCGLRATSTPMRTHQVLRSSAAVRASCWKGDGVEQWEVPPMVVSISAKGRFPSGSLCNVNRIHLPPAPCSNYNCLVDSTIHIPVQQSRGVPLHIPQAPIDGQVVLGAGRERGAGAGAGAGAVGWGTGRIIRGRSTCCNETIEPDRAPGHSENQYDWKWPWRQLGGHKFVLGTRAYAPENLTYSIDGVSHQLGAQHERHRLINLPH